MALIHGGQLQQVAQQYNIPIEQWLDLSTGIAPLSYPIPPIMENVWQNLPQHNPELITNAKHYYQCKNVTVTNGSQAIIKVLPALWQQKNSDSKHVYLPEFGYKEHAQAWRQAGYQLHFYSDNLPPENNIISNSVLVIINPNNPTGKLFKRKTLVQYQQLMQKLKGLLVIDEAFIDVISSEQSMCSTTENGNTLVFRSFGKFFGLAGIRIGFLIANKNWCSTFNEHLGPWQINGPAQVIAMYALKDVAWHQQQKLKLNALRKHQEALLWHVIGNDIIADINGNDLFLTITFYQSTIAEELYNLLCKQAVYVRLTDEKDKIRMGITTQCGLEKLKKTLILIVRNIKSASKSLALKKHNQKS